MTLVTLFWIIVFGLFVYMMMRKGGGCCGGHGHDHDGHNDHLDHEGPKNESTRSLDHHSQKISQDNGRDPVCGMDVTNTSAVSEFHGKTFRFCSEQCRKLFDLNPNKYVSF